MWLHWAQRSGGREFRLSCIVNSQWVQGLKGVCGRRSSSQLSFHSCVAGGQMRGFQPLGQGSDGEPEEGFRQWTVRGQKDPALPIGLDLAHRRAGGSLGVASSKERCPWPSQPSRPSHFLQPRASLLSTSWTPNSPEISTYRKVNLEVLESTRPLPQVLSTRCHLPSRYTAFQAWSNSPEKLCPVW